MSSKASSILRATIGSLLCATLVSCFSPCRPHFSGQVVDSETGEPVDSVQYKVYDDGDFIKEAVTDSAGHFDASCEDSHSAFLFGKCKEHQADFTKDGYRPATATTTDGDFDVVVRMMR